MRWQIKNGFTLVDKSDYELLKDYKWYVNSRGYAVRAQYLGKVNGRYKTATVCMHSEIMQTPKGKDTDHINRNRLDNRRSNLRICDRGLNVFNSNRSKKLPRGVSEFKGRFTSRITKDSKTIFLGSFGTIEEAAESYERAKNEVWSEALA